MNMKNRALTVRMLFALFFFEKSRFFEWQINEKERICA